MTVDVGRSHFMLVRLHSQRSGWQSIGLGVERIAVIHFYAMAVRKEEAVAGQHAAAIRGALLDAVLSRRLHQASERLNRGFGTAGLLRKCWQSGQRPTQY